MNFRNHRQVAFSETDVSGRVHFTAFLRWAEDAEHAFLREVGVPVFEQEENSTGWPRVRVQCDYLAPAVFGDSVEVKLTLHAHGKTSLSWEFQILKNSPEGATCCAKGSYKTVLVRGESGAEQPTSISREWIEKVKTALV